MAASREALENLLDGPTEKEKELGYFSVVPKGVKINQFDVSGKIVKVDLSSEILNMKAGGVACEKMLIKTQISETLKQFAPTKMIKITVDGKANQLETKDPMPGQKN
jgi:spore germination protein GerM